MSEQQDLWDTPHGAEAVDVEADDPGADDGPSDVDEQARQTQPKVEPPD